LTLSIEQEFGAANIMSDWEEYEVDSDTECDFQSYHFRDQENPYLDYDGCDYVEEDEICPDEAETREFFYNEELLEDEPEFEFEEEEIQECSYEEALEYSEEPEDEFFAYEGMDPVEEEEIEAQPAPEKEIFYNTAVFGDDEEDE